MRLANVTGLELGRHLHRRGGGAWWLEIPAAQTKTQTQTPIALPFPEALVPALEEYLARWRPQLARPALWLEAGQRHLRQPCPPCGSPATHGRRSCGQPHGFRDVLATTVAVRI